MRRLARILLNSATILSLLLCLASAGLWVRSHWRGDWLRWHGRPGPDGWADFAFATSGRGGASIGIGRLSPRVIQYRRWEGWVGGSFGPSETVYALNGAPTRWGFGRERIRTSDVARRALILPLWLPTALFAALPLARGALFIRRRRRGREGHCATCGYDLRATPERCPECGEVPAGAPPAGSG